MATILSDFYLIMSKFLKFDENLLNGRMHKTYIRVANNNYFILQQTLKFLTYAEFIDILVYSGIQQFPHRLIFHVFERWKLSHFKLHKIPFVKLNLEMAIGFIIFPYFTRWFNIGLIKVLALYSNIVPF